MTKPATQASNETSTPTQDARAFRKRAFDAFFIGLMVGGLTVGTALASIDRAPTSAQAPAEGSSARSAARAEAREARAPATTAPASTGSSPRARSRAPESIDTDGFAHRYEALTRARGSR